MFPAHLKILVAPIGQLQSSLRPYHPGVHCGLLIYNSGRLILIPEFTSIPFCGGTLDPIPPCSAYAATPQAMAFFRKVAKLWFSQTLWWPLGMAFVAVPVWPQPK